MVQNAAELRPRTGAPRAPLPTIAGAAGTPDRPGLDPEALIWAEVNLDALAANVRVLRSHVGPRARLVAVVKANAYGHGAVPVAAAALAAGADSLAVGRLDEAVELRRAGITAPILVMGPVLPSGARRCVALRLTPTVHNLTMAQALAHAARAAGRVLPVHVKVDTGMNRFGLLTDEAVAFTSVVTAIAGLAIEGLYTHFATADVDDLTVTRQQLTDFLDVVGRLRAAGIAPAVLHAANSAATLALPATHLDQVRVGAALYGLHTTDARAAAAGAQLNGERWHASGASALRPVLTLQTRVIRLRHVPAGTPVSYGGTYHTTEATCLATLAAGYGDGLSVALSNRGAVLLGGRVCPIVGRVCMDQLVVDCRDSRGIQEGDAAVLIGQQGAAAITAEDVAAASGSTNYEVVTRLLVRVPRFYHRSQALTSALHPLQRRHNTWPQPASLPRLPSFRRKLAIQTDRGATNGAVFRHSRRNELPGRECTVPLRSGGTIEGPVLHLTPVGPRTELPGEGMCLWPLSPYFLRS